MTFSLEKEMRTAEEESDTALESVFRALRERRNFKLEAGAGAGKTYSLIAALQRILADRKYYLPRSDQQIACLTYTKVARDQIINRTDANPYIFADTLHGFLWEMVKPYQKALKQTILSSEDWQNKLEGRTALDDLIIEYDLGIRIIDDTAIRIHHDDVPRLANKLFRKPKFRTLIADHFPIIFIDEYQDTPQGLVEAMLSGLEPDSQASVFGFFGDHWQQIYDNTCGSIEHSTVIPIPKNANFRSDRNIVSFLNKLRPELVQAPADNALTGTVTIYHTNEWPSGDRLTHHWKGQIPHIASHRTLEWITNDAQHRVWGEASKDTKTLMLTHASLAHELGYESLPAIYKYNDSFAKKEDPVIAFLLDIVEPSSEAFRERRYGELFDVLGSAQPHIRSHNDKVYWTSHFEKLDDLRNSDTVGAVLSHLRSQTLFSIPQRVLKTHRDLEQALGVLNETMNLSEPRHLSEYQKLLNVKYAEIMSLSAYVNDKTPFSTKHNVKGAEFDNVIVVLGRGYSKYDFAKMLDNYPSRDRLIESEYKKFERSRNLFYVAASRAKRNLVLLFTQELSDATLEMFSEWVGADNVVSVNFSSDGQPV
ncbi:UvrD-helicase domain-containing protein [Kocuria arenosa]|uniref:UvrD-helicase domain-containing protein n=1 Tax=Kocuria arenosa TaxID=3071446 RepID=UPI0034D61BB3